jgi:hypothetical protein
MSRLQLAGADFMFDEAFGHKSMVTAVMNTLSLWLMGIFLYLVAHWPLLTRWLKRTSMKPGEGTPTLSETLYALYYLALVIKNPFNLVQFDSIHHLV